MTEPVKRRRGRPAIPGKRVNLTIRIRPELLLQCAMLDGSTGSIIDKALVQYFSVADTVRKLRDVITHDAETKADFVARVRSVLSATPDVIFHQPITTKGSHVDKLLEKHIEMVVKVNSADSEMQHTFAERELYGFRRALEALNINQLMECDWHYLNQGIDRPMCCGVFLDWQPAV